MNGKSWYRSKSIWIAILQGIGGIMVAVGTEYDQVGGFLVLKSLLDIIVRGITDAPIFFSGTREKKSY